MSRSKPTATLDPDGAAVTIRRGSLRSITIEPGSSVVVRDVVHDLDDAFGAIVTSVRGLYAHLTFTPPGRPRRVPLGCILASAPPAPAMLDLSSIPRFAPAPTTAPYRKRSRD